MLGNTNWLKSKWKKSKIMHRHTHTHSHADTLEKWSQLEWNAEWRRVFPDRIVFYVRGFFFFHRINPARDCIVTNSPWTIFSLTQSMSEYLFTLIQLVDIVWIDKALTNPFFNTKFFYLKKNSKQIFNKKKQLFFDKSFVNFRMNSKRLIFITNLLKNKIILT